ncbi:hypothetical protein [Nocardia wallacei]|uniref:hypothetical protein n=1 Tax=Nocardia wallacei TaxID=480035 RepID=UPI0024561D6A|nr:hypothetical protein [Nocardia wallacei]
MIVIVAVGIGVTATVVAPVTISMNQGSGYPQPGAVSPDCTMLCDSGPVIDDDAPARGGNSTWTVQAEGSLQGTMILPPPAATYQGTQPGCVMLCEAPAAGDNSDRDVSTDQGPSQAPFGITTPTR